MPHFLYKLIPPRSTFPMDMTEQEAAIMQAHFGYWADVIANRMAVAYGPVADPEGTYGVAILDVADEGAAQQLVSRDPAVVARAGFDTRLYSMPDAIVRP